MEILLNASTFELPLLCRTVESVFHPKTLAADRAKANQVLTQLRQEAFFYQNTPTIVESTETSMVVKIFAIDSLTEAIKYRWKILEEETQKQISSYVVSRITQLADVSANNADYKQLLSKFNLTLVALAVQTWPRQWPDFLQSLCASARSSEAVCENSLKILYTLGEEIFEFGEEMVSTKTHAMKTVFINEVSTVVELCQFVMANTGNVSLILAAIKCLHQFISWMPLNFIFNTSVIEVLIKQFLPVKTFRTDVIMCLTKVVGLKDIPDEYRSGLCSGVFASALDIIRVEFSPETDLKSLYGNMGMADQDLIQRFTMFLTRFLTETHVSMLEQADLIHLEIALTYLVHISAIGSAEEMQLFKICLDFWHDLSRSIFQRRYRSSSGSGGTGLGSSGPSNACENLYNRILEKVRFVMIENMAKPEEVLIEEDEAGEIVRAEASNTDALALYQTMKETLEYLCHLDADNTERIMLEILSIQMKSAEFVWHPLNTLCWAIGSISGSMVRDDEKRFLVLVIKDLLYLCEQKTGKENKAVVASNIMYVVGQYPNFLREHWKFLKTVVNKLFEFMHETHPGVQDMACETFIKIAKHCKKQFVAPQINGQVPFINELLARLDKEICDLKTHQVHTFYEAVAHMITAESNPNTRESLLFKLMESPNQIWTRVQDAATTNMEVLMTTSALKELHRVVRTNLYVCKALGSYYVPQMIRLNLSLLFLYKTFSEKLNSQYVLENQNDRVYFNGVARQIIALKKEILRLIAQVVENTDNTVMMASEYIPTILETILVDYQAAGPSGKLPEVLNTFTRIFNTLGEHMVNHIGVITEKLLPSTSTMITKDFISHQDLRLNFYLLLKSMTSNCFLGLFNPNVPVEWKSMVVGAMLHGVRHTERNISETGLSITLHVCESMLSTGGALAAEFFQMYYIQILDMTFWVMTDRLHKSGFRYQSSIVKLLFGVANSLPNPLYSGNVPPGTKNDEYIQSHVADILISNFNHLSGALVKTFMAKLFQISDSEQFRISLRDFLLAIKEFAGEDNSDLFPQESTIDATNSGSGVNGTGVAAVTQEEMSLL